ncbi:proteasome subunit beta type [Striga asiatica]|uniref:Proteasome subunit beta type n=1 Tax=Striga asiatica TaxID=4170 RepID=A0A5A7PTK3_STRAF|nr:proteasome subunit beta type [Striga asiatica]
MDVTSGDLDAPHSMGTTIIGVTYNGGVVLGADSRTSTGMYVANRASDKITQLTDNVYICRSGSFLWCKKLTACIMTFSVLSSLAADSQIVSDYVRYYLHQHTIQLGQPATVKVAANLVRLLSYNNKNMLQTGLIVGGWDKYNGGKIYGVPLGGTVLELPFTIGGSGSSYLYGFFDQEWREGMTREEAEQLVVKAVSLAIARDGASGGVIRTVTINEDGATRKFYPGDTHPLWHEELAPQDSLLDNTPAASPMIIIVEEGKSLALQVPAFFNVPFQERPEETNNVSIVALEALCQPASFRVEFLGIVEPEVYFRKMIPKL